MLFQIRSRAYRAFGRFFKHIIVISSIPLQFDVFKVPDMAKNAFVWSHCLILIQPVVCMFANNFRTNLRRLYLKTDTNLLLCYDGAHIKALTA